MKEKRKTINFVKWNKLFLKIYGNVTNLVILIEKEQKCVSFKGQKGIRV